MAAHHIIVLVLESHRNPACKRSFDRFTAFEALLIIFCSMIFTIFTAVVLHSIVLLPHEFFFNEGVMLLKHF